MNDGETLFTQQFGIAISDDITGIEEVATHRQEQNSYFYNLNGQRLLQPQRGINIVGGKGVSNGRRWKKLLVK